MIKKYNLFVESTNQPCINCLNNYLREISNSFISINESAQDSNIKSLSIAVPTKKCINNCKFCCSVISAEQETEEYLSRLKDPNFEDEYFSKMEYVRKRGCKYVMLTGDGEALQNKRFLEMYGRLNKELTSPFYTEIQTTGVLCDDNNLSFLKNKVGVDLISLSISDIFDDHNNANIVGTPVKLQKKIDNLCKAIKKHKFTLRLSINLINVYAKHSIEELFSIIEELGADQVTFRVLWQGTIDNNISRWIEKNNAPVKYVDELKSYIYQNGVKNEGNIWMVDDISVVIDEDCMDEIESHDIRYLILRSDCNLYRKWNDKSTIVNI